jgi:hypothetical protein
MYTKELENKTRQQYLCSKIYDTIYGNEERKELTR